MRRYLTAGAIVGLLVLGIAGITLAEAQSRATANSLGITMVRFKKDATPAQMRSAVKDAGGEVTTDLTKINAIAAVGNAADFAARIATNSRVTSVWADRLSVRRRRIGVPRAIGF